MSKTFVLIHGTWHGGWAWNDLMRKLTKKGLSSHAPTLPGHGPGVKRNGINHRNCVEAVVAYLQEYGLKNVILVGHSFGGTVVQKVAEQLSDRIARLIFLNALVLMHDECVFDVLPDAFLDSLTAKNGDAPAPPTAEGTNDILAPPPWETWRDNFIQDAPGSLARSTWKRLSPEPAQVNLDYIDLERFESLSIPKRYIYCRQDKAMPPGYFHPKMSSRLRACRVLEMDGSHEVMFTRPMELAEKIVEASCE